MKRPCAKIGCFNLQPCALHIRKPFATARRSSNLYGTARWKLERRAFLDVFPYCRLCGERASVVDHDPPHRGDIDAFWDRRRYRSLCWKHHQAKTGRETRERIARKKIMATACRVERYPNLSPCPTHTDIFTVVTGPPCSGKSTYILNNMAHGDVMVDFDRIAQAISPNSPNYEYPDHIRELVRAMRLTAITHTLDTQTPNVRLWIIDTALNDHAEAIARYKRDGATVIELDPGMDVCIERAERERPAEIVSIIRRWYANPVTI